MKGWKTLAFNIAAAVLTVLIAFNWESVLEVYPWAPAIIVAVANVALRFVTTTQIGKSE